MSVSNWRCWCLSVCLLVSAAATSAPYEWHYPAPVLTPTAAADNGKRVLFDVSHGGTEGNADWVINGGFSDFADALVYEGYTVEEYRGVDKNGDGVIQFVDDYNNPTSAATNANEAVITYAAISHADVLILAESNRPFTQSEQAALMQFAAAGKGIFFIADHYNADRNLNSWDSTEVYNGYNRATSSQFSIGGAYGDLRNPGNASQGWLAENFGIRFRFNAINWLSGVSGIVSVAQSEGITNGVAPVLMAAGSTLAITDPSRAKGLVYFGPGDNPTAWGHAVDSGLYYGGTAEGPYVAIAKSGAGKAAFIGDSSPIEDSSPRYRREDSGSTKSTYPGWTDSGNAAQLCVNIVNWLATPESYTQFNSSAHPAGTATPNPMASQELSDPDNGQPWSTPSGSYNPWDHSTFANGAYGAPFAVGGGSGSTSSSASSSSSSSAGGSLSVSQALAQAVGTGMTVTGVITQPVNGIYALEIADSSNPSATIYVKLESQYRADFSPQNNPSLIGQSLQVSGSRDTYMGGPSIEYVTAMALVTASASSSSSSAQGNCVPAGAVSVETAYASTIGTGLTVVGEVIGGVNGPYALELGDLQTGASVYVKLESSQRSYFSPANNPGIVGKTLLVDGTRDLYMSYPSLEAVTSLQELAGCN